MVGKGCRIPERWTDYVPLGRRLPGTRFIAFKVPLKKSFEKNLHPEERFSPRDLIKKIREQKEELGLIIDLTYTTRYYGPEELPDTLCYSKIFTMGHEIPSSQTFFQFKCVVNKFLRDNKDNDKLIGVHCTHGLNRTGYLVCRYLIDVEGMEPNTAIELFNRARGHPIERPNYIQDLRKRSVKKNCKLQSWDLGPFRGNTSTAPGTRKQMVKCPPQKPLEQPPLAMPRNFGSTKKHRKRSSKAQGQPQEVDTQPRATKPKAMATTGATEPQWPRGLATRNSWVSPQLPDPHHGLCSPQPRCPPEQAAKKRRRRRKKPLVMQ